MDLHNDLEIHHSLCIFIIILSPITYFLLTRKVIAPFGKHTSSIENKSINWGPCINPKLAWFIFESPNLLWSIYAFFHRKEYIFDNIANVTLFSLFSIHYVQRCIIYPMRMNESATLVNLAIMSSAFIFCCINGFLQTQQYCQFHVYPSDYHTKPHFIIGVCVWLIGFIVNIQSDSILLRLRSCATNNEDDRQTATTAKAQRYKIPYGGLFRYVSCANFFGEILEWLGYATASSSIAAWSFWFFVCANLVPRGIAHHEWYVQKFKEDYPKNRCAVIPFIK